MNLRRFSTPALLVAVTALAFAPLWHATPARAAGKTVTVTMTDNPPRFVPQKLKIKTGTTVEWKNTGQTMHDVSTVASSAQKKADAVVPAGAKPFDSGFMAPASTYKHTFTVPGHYVYFCLPHEKDGMVGEIDVTK